MKSSTYSIQAHNKRRIICGTISFSLLYTSNAFAFYTFSAIFLSFMYSCTKKNGQKLTYKIIHNFEAYEQNLLTRHYKSWCCFVHLSLFLLQKSFKHFVKSNVGRLLVFGLVFNISMYTNDFGASARGWKWRYKYTNSMNDYKANAYGEKYV